MMIIYIDRVDRQVNWPCKEGYYNKRKDRYRITLREKRSNNKKLSSS